MSENAPETDELTGVATTDHVWDNIRELNNPLPRWWLWLFYITVIWSVGYMIVMPSFPLLTSYTKGILGHSQREQVLLEQEAAVGARAELANRLVESPLETIESTPELFEFAMANGRAAFGDNCAPCHGTGGTGSVGYPNLQDDVWLWGGTLEEIHHTVNYGIRTDHDDARFGEMVAFGRDEILDREDIAQVANYVASRAGIETVGDVDMLAGATIFAENCATCHGDDGEGLKELGAPNLTDKVWLYGSTVADIRSQIDDPRNGVMPAWVDRLDPATVKSLAVYVHSFGGGQ